MFVKSAYTRQKKQHDQLIEKSKFYTNFIIESRDKIIKNVFYG